MIRLLTTITIGFFIYGCSSPGPKQYSLEEIETESDKANAFFEKTFNQAMDRSPVYQSYLGIKKDYDKWDNLSEANTEKELEITKKELQFLLDSINPDALDLQGRISYKLFK